MSIHPTAIIEEGARVGAGCVIHAHAIVTRHAVLGDGVVVHPFAVVGGDPQDLRFDPSTRSGVRVGDGTVVREHVTIHRATKADGWTEVGAGCFLMVSSHVAHDCRLADKVILANAVLLAGHVHVGAGAFVGGGALVHQFARIGEGTMIGGGAHVARDVPPFTLMTRRDELIGLNVVGLRRRGLPAATFAELKRAFRAVNVPVGNVRELAADALSTGGYQSAEVRRFLEFFAGGKRGFARVLRGSNDESAGD
ncbi:MAG: acyl-ACP--UDP-N-acetylglucosamine O-acyltransferase [Gammaproteobacteria bacterium]|nr:acyl-ACP--UDP-N-acetylglucosamine O-acyltransferase [Gammaproteobacteria bacterium]